MFYPGRYHKDYGSIFPMGDLTLRIPSEEADVCILEEPEHLNWYRAPGRSWRRAFKHVVGIVHTNYLAYASTYSVWGPLLTFMLRCCLGLRSSFVYYLAVLVVVYLFPICSLNHFRMFGENYGVKEVFSFVAVQ